MKYGVKRWDKSRISYIHFGYADFYDFDNFVVQIMENLKVDVGYSIMLKVNFNEDRYCMLGKQMGFRYSEEESIEKLEYFHDLCKNMVNNLWDNYDVENIKSIQVLYVLISDIPKLQLKNVNSVNFNKDFTNVRESRERFNLIPLTLDMNYYGKPVNNRDDFISLLNEINNQRDLLNKDKLDIDDKCKMYLYNDSLIILNMVQDNNTYCRGVYDAKLGVLIHEIKDVVIGDNHFVRTIGNVNLTIIDNIIVKVESVKVLSPITYKGRSLKDEPNPFIGSWDVEAFEMDGYAKVYALGFKVLNKESKMYYMDDGITSDELVLQCIDDMLVSEYNGYTFYTHNFGKYDSIFLMKILKEANIRLGYEHYVTKELDRGGKMLKLVIKVRKSLSDRKSNKIGARKDPGYNIITIVDSLNILNQSLADLSISFGVDVVKGYFPYSFVKSSTLHYVGDTPEFKYWEKISLEEYRGLVKSDWSLKEECLKYLDKDLTSLVMIMHKFSEYINRKYYLQVTDSLTISRLALNIFMKDYLKEFKLPIIRKNMFSDIKQAYYGGVTEVYRPYGKNLLHYDVNSLYPFAALNPIPGINCTFIENLNKSMDIKDLFGFFYCEIKTGDNYLGLLPVHHEQGMIMPNGSWRGWYFSEELKYAAENGYMINIIKGYNFNKVDGVFNDYVKDLYKIKSSTNDRVEKDIAKRLLNHLLGRFGLNITKPVTKYVTGDDLSLLFSSREIIGKPIKITSNDYKITYNSQIDPDICRDHGIDYIKVLNLTTKTDVENVNEFKDVSLTTAAAVTAYARIYMSKIKLDVLNKGGNIYYTDTDSIVTDIPLDDALVGEGLGQFKLEYKIKQGYYISNKTYYIDLAEKIWDKRKNEWISFIIKSKTVDSKSLSLDSFKALYNNKNVEAIKRSSIKDYDKGSVLITDQNVKLSHNAYTKREKIHKRGEWVDTKPLVLDGYLKKKGIVKYKKFVWPTLSGKIKEMLNFISALLLSILTLFLHMSIEGIELDCLGEEHLVDVNWDLENQVELRYNDDYLEEPIEVELYNYDKERSWFKSFLDMFMNRSSYNNDVHMHVNNSFVNSGSCNDTSSDNMSIERPQVLITVLKDHIESLCNEISVMKEDYSMVEVKRMSSQSKIDDALILCEEALRNSLTSEGDNPIAQKLRVYGKSPSIRLYTSFDNSPALGSDSPILQKATAFGDSPILGRNSPLSGKVSPFLGKGTTFLDKGNTLTTSTPLMTKYEGLLIDNASSVKNTTDVGYTTTSVKNIMNTSIHPTIDSTTSVKNTANSSADNPGIATNNVDYTVPRKYPIRTVESPSVLRRYGNIWSGEVNIESPSTIKRYGWVSPAGTSVLEDYSPLAKRHGHIFSENFTLRKDYTVITEHNNIYKPFSPHVD